MCKCDNKYTNMKCNQITCYLLSICCPKIALMVKSEASHMISNDLDQSGCNAPISRVRRCYCDIYTQVGNTPCIYAKHQYKQESEYGSKWCIIHSNIWYNYKVITRCDAILQEYYISDRRKCENTKRCTSMNCTKGGSEL